MIINCGDKKMIDKDEFQKLYAQKYLQRELELQQHAGEKLHGKLQKIIADDTRVSTLMERVREGSEIEPLMGDLPHQEVVEAVAFAQQYQENHDFTSRQLRISGHYQLFFGEGSLIDPMDRKYFFGATKDIHTFSNADIFKRVLQTLGATETKQFKKADLLVYWGLYICSEPIDNILRRLEREDNSLGIIAFHARVVSPNCNGCPEWQRIGDLVSEDKARRMCTGGTYLDYPSTSG